MSKSYDIVKWEGTGNLTVGNSTGTFSGTIYRKRSESAGIGWSSSHSTFLEFGSISRTVGYGPMSCYVGWYTTKEGASKKFSEIKSGDKAQLGAFYNSNIGTTNNVGEFTVIPNGGVEYDRKLRLQYGNNTVDYDSGTAAKFYNSIAQGSGSVSLTAPKTYQSKWGFVRFTNTGGGTASGLSVKLPYEQYDQVAVALYGPKFTVVFNKNATDASGTMENQSFVNGVSQSLTANAFSRKGCTFLGWSKSSTATSPSYEDGQDGSGLSSTAGATVNLYAVWEEKTSTVTLDQPNATTAGTNLVNATYGRPMPPITRPQRTGWTFAGYFTSANGAGTKYYNADGSSAQNWDRTEQDVTLHAHWTRNTHRVTVTNTDPTHCKLSVTCAEPALDLRETHGVLAFDAAEYSDYAIVATYSTKFNAKKYALQGFKSGTTTYAVTSPTYLTRQYTYTGGPSAPTEFQTVFQVAQQFDATIEVSCRIGNEPTVTLSPQKDDANGWFKQNLRIGIDYNENDAVEFETWSATRDGSPQPYDSYNPSDPEPMVFTIDANMTLRVAFKVKTCEATVSVQSASAAVVGSNAATVTVDQYTTGQTHWGDVANYSARTTGLPSGVEFDGWYKEDGSPADDATVDGVAYTFRDADYRIVLAGDIKLYAAYRAKVRLRAQAMPDSEAHGSVGIDGAYQENETFAYIRLGATCTIGVRTDNFFGGWFEGANPSYTTEIPLAYAQEDEIRVTGTRTLTAFILDEEEFNYIALYNFDAREGHEDWDPTLGAWSLTGDQSGFEEITKAQYEAAITEWHGGTAYTAPSDGRFFKVSGIKRANLRVQSASALGFANICRYHVDDLTEMLDQVDTNVATAVINDHYVFVANWGVLARRTITATRANGTERTFGDISIEDGTEAGDGSWSVKAEQNTYVTLVAVPRNGYKFVGWFADYDHAGVPESADREFRLKVQSTATYYAMFAQDANAIYEWEGGAASKRMEWRSKMFVASKPFNPVALRVDALGYPVECEVGVFSSPEAKAVRVGRVSPASQMARRLPLLRPERYVQVTVRADHEVDRVIVGTSMEGLNV